MTGRAFDSVSNEALERLWKGVSSHRPQGVADASPPSGDAGLHGSDSDSESEHQRKRFWSSAGASASAAAPPIGLRAGETSFDVDLGEWKKRRVLPEDGTYVEPDADPTEGGRFGPEWRDEMSDRLRVLRSHPDYQFIELVAGASNTNVERMFDSESVDRMLRTQLMRRQAEFAIAETQSSADALRQSITDIQSKQAEAEKALGRVLETERNDSIMVAGNAHSNAVRDYIRTVEDGRRHRDASNLLESVQPVGFVVPRADLDLVQRLIDHYMVYESSVLRVLFPQSGRGGEAEAKADSERYAEILFWNYDTRGPGSPGPRLETTRGETLSMLMKRVLVEARGTNDDDADPERQNGSATSVINAMVRHVLLVEAEASSDQEMQRLLEEALTLYRERYSVQPNSALDNLVGKIMDPAGVIRTRVIDIRRQEAPGLWLGEARALYTMLDTGYHLLMEESPLSAVRATPFRRTREIAEDASRQASRRSREQRTEDTSIEALRELLRARRQQVDDAQQTVDQVAAGAAAAAADPRAERALRALDAAERAADIVRSDLQRAIAARDRVLANPRNRIMNLQSVKLDAMRGNLDDIAQLIRNADALYNDNPLEALRAAGLTVQNVLAKDQSLIRRLRQIEADFQVSEEQKDVNRMLDMRKWADGMSWYESVGGTLFRDMQIKFPANESQRTAAQWGVEDIPDWSSLRATKFPPDYSPQMQVLWRRHIPDFVTATDKSDTQEDPSRREAIVFDILTGKDVGGQHLDAGNVWTRGPVLVFAFRLYRTELAVARDEMEQEISHRQSLLQATRERLDKMLRGEPAQPRASTVPYEHRRAWVERPENSGTVQLIPIVVQGIGDAWRIVSQYAPHISEKITLEEAQRDPRMRHDLANLVAVQISFFAQRFPKMYYNPTHRAATNVDLYNVVHRFKRNYALDSTGVRPGRRITPRRGDPNAPYVARIVSSSATRRPLPHQRDQLLWM